MGADTLEERARYVGGILVLAGLYAIAAKFGIEQPVAHGVITPVWAPTGIAIAALVILGPAYWPGVAAGALIANATSGVGIGIAAGICIGNTMEALAAAYLLKRVSFRPTLDRIRDVIAFVGLGAIVATTLSATVGTTSLRLGDVAGFGPYPEEWLLWWFGDVIGALLVAPLILVCWANRKNLVDVARPLEGLGLVILLIATSVVVFIGGSWKYPYLIFPLLVWAALRFKQVGAATAVFIVGAIGTWGTVHGSVPIGGATSTQSVQILQALVAVMALSAFMIAATILERDAAERQRARASANLEEAQALVHIGSWEWDIQKDRVWWSDEMYRIYGFKPQSFLITFERAMEPVRAEDRGQIETNVRDVFAGGVDREVPVVQYRIDRDDGATRTLRGWGVVQFNEGTPTKMVGTVQDVTDAVGAEAALHDALARERLSAEQLRELDTIKNTFISAVAHDLRTPLATIGGFASTLAQHLETFSPADTLDVLTRIEANADRANRMLANLLDLDRLQRGAIHASPVEIDLRGIVLRIVHSLELKREVTVDEREVSAWADEVLVERMIENLLLNAVRHTPDTSSIWVRFHENKEGVEIVVEDDGPGISDDMKESVFAAFKRGPERNAGGTGLGLFLVQQFADLQRGRAWVEDRPSGGAAFRIHLPAP
ncbi:MAG: MASE1 domain-containing protein [Gaiellales bacterium]